MSSSKADKMSAINELLRLITSSCKLPLSGALPVASALVKAGISTKEEIGARAPDELQKICGGLTPQQLQKLQKACSSKSSAKRRASTLDGTSSQQKPAPSKRGRKFGVKNAQEPIDDTALALPTTDDLAKIGASEFSVNRAPLMMLFAYCVLTHLYPSFGAGSYLSIASATASSASRTKAKSIGIKPESSNVSEESLIPKGLRRLKSLGSIEVGVIRRGDVEEGYWGLDLDAMEKKALNGIDPTAAVGNMPELKASDATWIHPAQVRDYLFRSLGEENLAAAHGAIELVIQSWLGEEPESDLSMLAWQWYVRVRPTVAFGAEGWGQKGRVKCSDILGCRYKRS